MKNPELCYNCIQLEAKDCQFKALAQKIEKASQAGQICGVEANEIIVEIRENTRKHECPFINDVIVNLPGL